MMPSRVARPSGHRQGEGCGQSQGAGTGHDEDGDRGHDRIRHGLVEQQPHREREHCDPQDRKREVRGDSVGQSLDGGFGRQGLLDERRDARQPALGHRLRHHRDQRPFGDERAGVEDVARLFRKRGGFSGKKRFVHHRRSLQHNRVCGHALSLFDQYLHALDKRSGLSRDPGSVAPDPARVRLQGQKRVDISASPASTHRFQISPGHDKRGDHRDRVEVGGAAAGDGDVGAVAEGGQRSEGDQGVHRRRAGQQGSPGAAQEGDPADEKDGDGQAHGQVLEGARLGARVVALRIAGIEHRQVDHHHLHPEGRRDDELQEDAFQPLLERRLFAVGEEPGAVAQPAQPGQQTVGVHLGGVVGHPAPFGGVADIGAAHSRLAAKQSLRRGRASGAPHPLKGEVGRLPRSGQGRPRPGPPGRRPQHLVQHPVLRSQAVHPRATRAAEALLLAGEGVGNGCGGA